MSTDSRDSSWDSTVMLVTGGTKGIGRATTLQLLERGATVAANYCSDVEAAEELQAAAEQKPGDLVLSRFDVSDQTSVDEHVSSIWEEQGKITHVVNNAGILTDYVDPVHMMDEEDWDRIVDVNLKGMYNVTKCVVRQMVGNRREAPLESVVNVSSIGGMVGIKAETNYAASKSGVLGLTRTLSKELERYDVRVNAIVPGYTKTDIVADFSFPGRSHEELREELRDGLILDRFAEPKEVANVIRFLSSDEASYVTGATWEVDGGRTIR